MEIPRRRSTPSLTLVLIFASCLAAAQAPAPKDVDIDAPDGVKLRATFFAAEKPGPAVLLLHMCNTTRKSWEPVAKQLAQSGINALTIDNRGFGESGGPRYDVSVPAGAREIQQQWRADFDAVMQYLVTQPGVYKERLAVGGGSCGVDNAVKVAEHRPDIKAMVLLAGTTDLDGDSFIFKRADIPIFTAAADDDEYSPVTVQTMEWYAQLSGNPRSRSVSFRDGRHGTEIFGPHPELVTQIVAFYVDTLISKPSGPVLNPRSSPAREFMVLAARPGDAEKATEMFHKARKKNAKVFLFPEAVMNLLAYGRLQSGGGKHEAVELFKLNVEAYPASANAQDSLSDGYLALDQKDLALAAEEKCLELLPADPAAADFKTQLKAVAEKKVADLKARKTQ